MKRKISTLKQSDLILEIRHVNPVFVSRYRQAMRKGNQFPPLIVDQDNVIISGNHRYEAYRDEYGEDHTIEVERKTFENDAERIKTAVRENAKHGNPLDGISRKRAIQALLERDEKEEEIAELLGCSTKRIVSMAGQYVVVQGKRKPTKRGMNEAIGKEVSEKQYNEHETKDRAMSVHAQAEQLTRWLENGWVDLDNEKNVEALTRLAETLDKKLAILA